MGLLVPVVAVDVVAVDDHLAEVDADAKYEPGVLGALGASDVLGASRVRGNGLDKGAHEQ